MRPLGADLIPPLSDYFAFERAEVPFLFFTCGRWAHYHTPEDTPEKLDYDKIASTVDLLEALVVLLSNRSDRPVRYRKSNSDDALTLTAIDDIARRIADHRPAAQPIVARIEHMRREGFDHRRSRRCCWRLKPSWRGPSVARAPPRRKRGARARARDDPP